MNAESLSEQENKLIIHDDASDTAEKSTHESDDIGPATRGSTTHVNADWSTEPISCGDYVDVVMSALCGSKYHGQTLHEQSPVTVGNAELADVKAFPSILNDSSKRVLSEDNVTPELPR